MRSSCTSKAAIARCLFPGSAIGGGTPHFFVRISRLDALGDVDFASFTTSALVHGADDDDVMLGLTSLRGTVDSWRERHGAIPLRVGPNAIAARASLLGAQPASDGTRRIALGALAGPRGLVAVEGGRIQRHPALAVLQALGRPAELLACTVSHPGRIAALALRRNGRKLLLLANLTAEPQSVQLDAAVLLAPYAVIAHG